MVKNNSGHGLYEIGEREQLSCGCVIIAEEVGYTHYVHPECPFDNRFHAGIRNYQYKHVKELPLGEGICGRLRSPVSPPPGDRKERNDDEGMGGINRTVWSRGMPGMSLWRG